MVAKGPTIDVTQKFSLVFSPWPPISLSATSPALASSPVSVKGTLGTISSSWQPKEAQLKEPWQEPCESESRRYERR